MLRENDDLRIRPKLGRTSLVFPGTVDDRGEAEAVDQAGDAMRFTSERQLMLGLHDALPNDPLHPTVFLNAAVQDRPTPGVSRIAQTFEPSDLNRGNAVAAIELLDDRGEGTSTSVAWRRAGGAGGRTTAVGWGSFAPLPSSQRMPSRKGKERAVEPDEELSLPRFRTSAAPLVSTTSPIQQIQLAALPIASSALLAVRSQTSLDLVHLRCPTPFDPGEPPTTLARFSYSGAHLSRRPIADFILGGVSSAYGDPGAGLIVDTEGSLFGWGLGARGSGRIGDSDWKGAQPEVFRLRKGRKKGVRAYSGFARVGWGGAGGKDAVVALEDEVLLYDLRSANASLTLAGESVLSLHRPYGSTGSALITSLLSRSLSPPPFTTPLPSTSTATPLHAICTTQDVLWLDERMPGRDLLRWRHGRVGPEAKGVDRTLSLLELPRHTGDADGVQRVALTSRLHGRIDIFTTSADPTMAPQMTLAPYPISGPATGCGAADFVRGGLAVVPLPAAEAPFATTPAHDRMDLDSSSEDDGPASAAARRRRRDDSAADEAERARQSRTWRFVEVGMRGEVFEREVELARWGDDGAEVQEEREAPLWKTGQDWSEEVKALERETRAARQSRPEDEARGKRRQIDVQHVVERLGPDKVLEALGQEPVEDGIVQAGELLQLAGPPEEGDVGALTALELLSLSSGDRTKGLPAVGPLPRATCYAALDTASHGQASAIDTSTAPASLALHSAETPTPFSALLPQPPPTVALEPNDTSSPVARLAHLASRRVATESRLASQVIFPRALELDEPTMFPNQPQPAKEEPPALHLCYLRPRRNSPTNSDDDNDLRRAPRRARKKQQLPKPTLDNLGARLLLAEWHVGADPRSYAWHNPYDDAKDKDLDSLAYSQSQANGKGSKRHKKKLEAGERGAPSGMADIPPFSSSQPFPSSFPTAFPPSSSLPASSQSYFPSLAPPGVPPTIVEEPPASSSQPTQTQDWAHLAATQPTIAITGSSGPATGASPSAPGFFGGAASQVVPGAFGSRLAVGAGKVGASEREKKKKAKKRVSGF
ncbi:hypothetical protein Rhopal_001513-T1 [Rhodotorula paludigena]|uniref:RRN6 K-rich C-terminal domain-containing protein n=1 Tax=Rhodotorula paludigena TaxID=86838 RepID=A0AAV5GGN1_9BASI|nr:hypothetical protein Rhopal_001513-T1 [Rhodotorula paludigena]